VLILGKLFSNVWEIKNCNIHFAVFHAGSNNGAEEFTYKLSIKMHNEKISMRAICHSYLQETPTVLQPSECIVLHHGSVLKYLSKSSDLSCEIKIRRCSDSSVFRALFKYSEGQRMPTALANRPTTAPVSATNSPAQLHRDTRAHKGGGCRTATHPPHRNRSLEKHRFCTHDDTSDFT
jgi:hypothetical protein